ncbi:hypothetical protein [Rhodoferax sp.]|uniref:hypothetical protein n=1 Tax=Rhodoferax sp. TaxID=50421 RepID=UPI002627708C|nr:hypothetical protein [Rhodoferax sp.]MDD5479655.1 hypothetical protein [Rhodoferax sp.]
MPSKLPPQIEIFKPGRHVDDTGTAHAFSPADVAGMASSYDPALREAPLCIGHPKDNLPAYGLVQSLAVNAAGNLAMNTHAVEPQFAELVQAKRYAKRSASFYPPGHPNNPKPGAWYLRHVAFLGAQQPAIAGLRDIAFSAADAAGSVNFAFDEPQGTVNFSQATTPQINQENPMDEELKAQLAAAQKQAADNAAALATAQAATKKATDQLAQFAEAATAARHAGHVSFAEGEVKAGRLLPKDKGAAVVVLDVLASTQSVQFSEGDATKTVTPVEWLKGLIASARPVVSFGEHAPGAGDSGQASPDMSDAEVDKRAKAYALQHKVNYAEALSAVTASFTA